MTSNELFVVLSEMAGRADLDPELEALILVELTEPDPALWHGRISQGRLALSPERPEGEPDLTVTASSDTALGLFQKTVNPMTAFMTGKLKVKGDLAKITLMKELIVGRKK